MMVNVCQKYIKDILQELGSSICCFIFVNNKWHLPLVGGVIDTTTHIVTYIHKQLKTFVKCDSVLKFMHIAYHAKQFCIEG